MKIWIKSLFTISLKTAVNVTTDVRVVHEQVHVTEALANGRAGNTLIMRIVYTNVLHCVHRNVCRRISRERKGTCGKQCLNGHQKKGAAPINLSIDLFSLLVGVAGSWFGSAMAIFICIFIAK